RPIFCPIFPDCTRSPTSWNQCRTSRWCASPTATSCAIRWSLPCWASYSAIAHALFAVGLGWNFPASDPGASGAGIFLWRALALRRGRRGGLARLRRQPLTRRVHDRGETWIVADRVEIVVALHP